MSSNSANLFNKVMQLPDHVKVFLHMHAVVYVACYLAIKSLTLQDIVNHILTQSLICATRRLMLSAHETQCK